MLILKTLLFALAGALVARFITTRRRSRSVRIDHQQGGFAGAFASPGLGVDDADEAVSGLSTHALGRYSN